MATNTPNQGRKFGELVGIAVVSVGMWELGKFLLKPKNGELASMQHAELPHEVQQDTRLSDLRARLEAIETDRQRYIPG